MAVILAHLIQTASALPADASALERSISALDKAITAKEVSSGDWERWMPAFAFWVAVGVAIEIVVIVREYLEGRAAWHRATIRLPEKPHLPKLIWELMGAILVTAGVGLEFWGGAAIAQTNGDLRSLNAQLRSESTKLVELLKKETEDEHLFRVEAEESVAWRSLTKSDRQNIALGLSRFSVERTWLIYNVNDVEAYTFGHDLAEALPKSWHPTEPEPIQVMSEGPVPLGTSPPLERGVLVSNTRNDEPAKQVEQLLGRLGFDCQSSKGPSLHEQHPEQQPATVFIFIESRPKGPQGEAKLRAEARKKKQAQASSP